MCSIDVFYCDGLLDIWAPVQKIKMVFGGNVLNWTDKLVGWGNHRLSFMVNFFLKKMFCGNLNETDSANEIASCRFSGKIFL